MWLASQQGLPLETGPGIVRAGLGASKTGPGAPGIGVEASGTGPGASGTGAGASRAGAGVGAFDGKGPGVGRSLGSAIKKQFSGNHSLTAKSLLMSKSLILQAYNVGKQKTALHCNDLHKSDASEK